MNSVFFLNNILLGVGLSMDAFSVSLANGLSEPSMRHRKTFSIAGVFAVFQGIMPLAGWLCVHTVVQYFTAFEKFIPWIALVLLCYIGGKMLYDGIKSKGEEEDIPKGLSFSALLVQGIATSIDALSVGFTISEYNLSMAVFSALMISFVTFAICFAGVLIGRKFGTKLAGEATIFGGIILILIGIEIFITGVLF